MNPIPGLAIPTSPKQSGETARDARRRFRYTTQVILAEPPAMLDPRPSLSKTIRAQHISILHGGDASDELSTSNRGPHIVICGGTMDVICFGITI